jgi:hypothetical protein
MNLLLVIFAIGFVNYPRPKGRELATAYSSMTTEWLLLAAYVANIVAFVYFILEEL